jgi:pimeloyl-ACP methyl ester carboxylesterase
MLAVSAGCGGDDDGADFGADPAPQCSGPQQADTVLVVEAPAPLPPLVTSWSDCPLYDDGSKTLTAACADVAMPLWYDAPPEGVAAGGTMSVHVKRYGAGGAAQLWMLSGGPGASATALHPSLMEALQSQLQLDVFTADQRGTGLSERLSCPLQEDAASAGAGRIHVDELAGCAAAIEQSYAERAHAYAASLSAIDLAALIEDNREPGKPVYVWGGSYGTFLAQRFLLLFPDLVDGVILEAINKPDRSSLNFGEGIVSAIEKLMDRCAQDVFCAGKLGADPRATYVDTIAALAQDDHCTELTAQLSTDDINRLSMGLAQSPSFNVAVPALIYRLARCGALDVQWVIDVNAAITGAPPPSGNDWSWPLYNQIILSELVFNSEFPSQLEVDALSAEYDAMPHLIQTSSSLAERHAQWGGVRYCDLLWDDGWPSSDVPLLMLEGDLDPLTPSLWADDVGAHFAAATQHYALFPHATHGVTFNTPYTGGTTDCALSLWAAFVVEPTAPLDTSCVAQTIPLDFEPPAAVVAALGVGQLWENN